MEKPFKEYFLEIHLVLLFFYIVREKGSQGYNFIKGWEEDIGEGKGDLHAIYTSHTLI